MTAKAPESRADLRSLGRRLERLMHEREDADQLRSVAGAAFKEIAPKLMSPHKNFDASVIRAWDGLLDPGETASSISREHHWRIVQHIFDSKGVLPFKSLKSMAKKSGYLAAAERVRSIDFEIKDLASRALKIRAASLAGAKTQAMAFLALDQLRYGWSYSFAREDVLKFSRSLVALSKAQEASS